LTFPTMFAKEKKKANAAKTARKGKGKGKWKYRPGGKKGKRSDIGDSESTL